MKYLCIHGPTGEFCNAMVRENKALDRSMNQGIRTVSCEETDISSPYTIGFSFPASMEWGGDDYLSAFQAR